MRHPVEILLNALESNEKRLVGATETVLPSHGSRVLSTSEIDSMPLDDVLAQLRALHLDPHPLVKQIKDYVHGSCNWDMLAEEIQHLSGEEVAARLSELGLDHAPLVARVRNTIILTGHHQCQNMDNGTSLRVDKDSADSLMRLAEVTGRPKSWCIQKAVEFLVKEIEKESTVKEIEKVPIDANDFTQYLDDPSAYNMMDDPC